MTHNSTPMKSFLGTTLLGAAVAAAFYYFSDEQRRKTASEKVTKLRGQGMDYLGTARVTARDILKKTADYLDDPKVVKATKTTPTPTVEG